jgi:hypothetical protein
VRWRTDHHCSRHCPGGKDGLGPGSGTIATAVCVARVDTIADDPDPDAARSPFNVIGRSRSIRPRHRDITIALPSTTETTTMLDPAILYPVFALATWTGLVLLLILFFRVRAGMKRELLTDDFKFGESAGVPPHVSIPNRNYMNLLELPVLFYVVCLMLHVSMGAWPIAVRLAWAYVFFRIVHSLIHLTYNRVIHRLAAFALSNAALIALWVVAAMHIIRCKPV